MTCALGSCPVIPQTDEAKLLTIVYAAFGIPLLLFYLTVVGSALSSCFGASFRRMQRHWQPDVRSTKSADGVGVGLDADFNPDGPPPFCIGVKHARSYWPVIVCVTLVMVYMASGAWAFAVVMSMSLTDAILLSFMLFTTMGIPDAHSIIWTQTTPVVAVSLYIIVGLTLCSLCFNLIYEWILSRWMWRQHQDAYRRHHLGGVARRRHN